MKKTRADSKIESLPPAARAALTGWLFDDNLSYQVCDQRLQQQFSCSVGHTALSQFYQRQAAQRMIDRIASGRALAEGIATDLKAAAPLLEESTLQLIAQKSFDLAISQQTDIDGLATLTQLLLKARKQATDEKALALDREKFELLKKKAEMADATEQVITDAELTTEQREQRIKEIYGRS